MRERGVKGGGGRGGAQSGGEGVMYTIAVVGQYLYYIQ